MIDCLPTYIDLEKLEIDKMRSWFDLVSAGQNKSAFSYLKINNAFAFKATDIVDDIFFNRIHLLENQDTLNKAIEFYKNQNIKWYIDIPCPNINNLSDSLKGQLKYCGSYETLIFDLKSPISKINSDVKFKKVTIDLWNEVSDTFLSDAEYEFKNRFYLLPYLLRSSKWSFYIMYFNNKLIGIGGLFLNNELSAFSTTYILKKYRTLSFHEKLINYRLEKSANIGALYCIAQAYNNSISYKNLIKCHFKELYKSTYHTLIM